MSRAHSARSVDATHAMHCGRTGIGWVVMGSGARAQVAAMMEIERYSHVMHISSTVEGALLPELGVWDVLRAALPAGTISGAPKVPPRGLHTPWRQMCAVDSAWAERPAGPSGGCQDDEAQQPRRACCPACIPAAEAAQGFYSAARAGTEKGLNREQ